MGSRYFRLHEDAALGKIKAIVAIPEVGEVYEGTVRSIMPYTIQFQANKLPDVNKVFLSKHSINSPFHSKNVILLL